MKTTIRKHLADIFFILVQELAPRCRYPLGGTLLCALRVQLKRKVSARRGGDYHEVSQAFYSLRLSGR